MQQLLSRRLFLNQAFTASAAAALFPVLRSYAAESAGPGLDFPLVDCHVHLDNSTLEKVLALSQEQGVKYGIVEHAGTKENQYPIVLSNDEEMKTYLAKLKGKPVFKGIQAEWLDWAKCFSPEVLGQLDFVLSDAMTIRNEAGHRTKMWERGFVIGERQAFMDRYVDWHVEIMATEPLDIFANLTWLPDDLKADYNALWTEPRMEKIIRAALKYSVALEISGSYQIPKLAFLKLAKAAGAKFTFGSNGRYPNMGKLSYAIEMARRLELKSADMFVPSPRAKRQKN